MFAISAVIRVLDRTFVYLYCVASLATIAGGVALGLRNAGVM